MRKSWSQVVSIVHSTSGSNWQCVLAHNVQAPRNAALNAFPFWQECVWR
jgi:hypothetical protein